MEGTFDRGTFLEFRAGFAKGVITGLARLEGLTVGVVAIDRRVNRGFLGTDGSRKITEMAALCNRWKLPLITLLDSPGYMPSAREARLGLLRESERLIEEYSKGGATKITLVTGDAYGGVFVGMAGKRGRGREIFAYPRARIAVLGPSPYMEIFRGEELEKLKGARKKAEFRRIESEYIRSMNPSKALEGGFIDGVVKQEETRESLARAIKEAAELR